METGINKTPATHATVGFKDTVILGNRVVMEECWEYQSSYAYAVRKE